MNLKGQVEKYPNFPSVKVRGVEIDVTPTTINSLFCSEPIEDVEQFTRKEATKKNQLKWVDGIIATGYSTLASMGETKLAVRI